MQMEQIRRDIRDFKEKSGVDKVIVLWTANTERFSDVVTGANDTAKNLLATIQVNDRHIMPSSKCFHAHHRNKEKGVGHQDHNCSRMLLLLP